MITTVLFFYVVRQRWRKPLLVGDHRCRLLLDLRGAVLRGEPDQAHPRCVAAASHRLAVFTVMITWQHGRKLVTERREHEEGSLSAFVDDVDERRPPLPRVPGTAVFLNRSKHTTPLALRANVEHNHVLHEQVVILTVGHPPMPYVAEADRVEVDDLGHARRRHHPRRGPVRLHAATRCARGAAAGRGAGAAAADRPDRRVVLPLHHRALRHRRPRHGRAGASSCSSPPRGSRPTPPSTSTCRGISTVIIGSRIGV